MAPSGRSYFIHDNGARPFHVCVVSPTCVRVEKFTGYDYDEHPAEAYETLFEWDDIAEIFIGKSPLNQMTGFSGGHGPEFDGNSILLRRGGEGGPLRYVYIGSEIYEFEAPSRITRFVSPVGNNNVPYPFAFDATGTHCYLFLEQVCITQFPVDHRDSPYEWYYDACEQLQRRDGKMKIGNQIYNNHFSYKSDWREEYRRLQRLNRHDEDDPECDSICLVPPRNNGGNRQPHPLTAEEFIAQRESFAKDVLHAERLPNFQLLQKRKW